jgi:hypothetical protein
MLPGNIGPKAASSAFNSVTDFACIQTPSDSRYAAIGIMPKKKSVRNPIFETQSGNAPINDYKRSTLKFHIIGYKRLTRAGCIQAITGCLY